MLGLLLINVARLTQASIFIFLSIMSRAHITHTGACVCGCVGERKKWLTEEPQRVVRCASEAALPDDSHKKRLPYWSASGFLADLALTFSAPETDGAVPISVSLHVNAVLT